MADRSDDDHVDDALSTLKDAFDGSSSKTPALAMVPPLLASGIFSKSVVGMWRDWSSKSGSGRNYPTPH